MNKDTKESRIKELEELRNKINREGENFIAENYNIGDVYEEFLTPDDFKGINGILDGVPNDRYKSTNNKNKSKKRKK